MLKDRVKCATPNPGGPIGVGSTVTLGASPTGFRSFLAAFGAGNPAYFVLSDGAGKALGGIWTVNGDGTATVTSVLINDRLSNTSAETFSSVCTAWCALPAAGLGGLLAAAPDAAAARVVIGAPAIPTASAGVGQFYAIASATNTAVTLPAGGTWAYHLTSIISASGIWGNYRIASIAAGGATIASAVPNEQWDGFAWRIA